MVNPSLPYFLYFCDAFLITHETIIFLSQKTQTHLAFGTFDGSHKHLF